jgi:hypothetical protein
MKEPEPRAIVVAAMLPEPKRRRNGAGAQMSGSEFYRRGHFLGCLK